MGMVVHYDDDIFFAALCLKTLRQGLKLELDTDYFGAKYLEDLCFVDDLLGKIHAALKENTRLIERPDYLKSLVVAIRAFTDLVQSLISGNFPLSQALAPKKAMLNELREGKMSLYGEIVGTLRQSGLGSNDSDIVSQDEMSELFARSGE